MEHGRSGQDRSVLGYLFKSGRVVIKHFVLLRPWELEVLGMRRMTCPVGVPEVHSGDGTQVSSAGGEDGVDVRVGGDGADGHGRDADLVANSIAKRCLKKPSVLWFSGRHDLAC